MYGSRIVISRTKRKEVIQRLHAVHQGRDKSLQRARQAVFWPGLTSDVSNSCKACEQCQIHQPSQQKETISRDPMPSRIFEEVGADFFEYGDQHFMALIDCLSGWPQIYAFNKAPTRKSTIAKLRLHFAMVGVPALLRIDGGPQFVSAEMSRFLREWGIRHGVSSPHFPHSNRLAEAAGSQDPETIDEKKRVVITNHSWRD